MTDLNKQYVFPIQTVITTLCPDILMYSQSLNYVIIIELICPCEENMERWHSVNFNKYKSLVHTINKLLGSGGSRGGGYHYRSVLSCLRKIESPNKLARSMSKIPGHASMTWSFYIWQARNTRSWEIEHMSSQLSHLQLTKHLFKITNVLWNI